MKIVVASMGHDVAGHFGHCETFRFFDTADGKILSEQAVPNPGHRPGFLPNFLADHGAQVIISGGMGGGAVDIFNERGTRRRMRQPSRLTREFPIGKTNPYAGTKTVKKLRPSGAQHRSPSGLPGVQPPTVLF